MKKNALLMVVKTSLSLVFPLITFPYISRVLMVEAIGKYNFVSSIISYFILIAGLGVSTYAIREGAKIRESREKISEFASEMYLINWLSTGISYLLLLFCMLFSVKLQNYSVLLFILSVQILFTVYGKSWIYNVFEDFGYITVVQVIFQILSIICLFVFVHGPEDLNIYAVINVISATGSNILYGIHSKQYIDIHRVSLIASLKNHLKPVLIIFSTSIATMVYVNSDMTILGWIVDDRSVGLYSTAVKIYNIIKQVLVSVITVSIPRLTLFAGKKEYKKLFARIFNMLFFLALPVMAGLLSLSNNAILIAASEQYVDATFSLQLLSVALVFALLACFLGMGVLLPHNKEKIFFNSTVVSAVVNIVGNLILIPIYQYNAAAFTTVLSQAIAFTMCLYYSKEYIEMRLSRKSFICTILGCVGIVAVCLGVKSLGFSLYIETIVCIVCSVVVYFVIELTVKNDAVLELFESVRAFISRKAKLN